MIVESAGKWYKSKIVLVTIVVDVLALLCCYTLLFLDTSSWANWAKFAIVLYVVAEVVATLGLTLAVLIFKIAAFVKRKVTESGNFESHELLEKFDTAFDKVYKLLPLGRSFFYQLADLAVDIVIFGCMVTAGWFITAIIHAICVVGQYKLKQSIYSTLLTHLKSRTPPEEKNENINDLMDKLCNGEKGEK